jgi:hypothetical protein
MSLSKSSIKRRFNPGAEEADVPAKKARVETSPSMPMEHRFSILEHILKVSIAQRTDLRYSSLIERVDEVIQVLKASIRPEIIELYERGELYNFEE